MNLPTQITILGIPYQIKYVDDVMEVDFFKKDLCYGQTDSMTRSIRIYRKNTPIENIYRRLLHEIIHDISQELHFKTIDSNEDELDMLALMLTDVLIRNKWINIESPVKVLNLTPERKQKYDEELKDPEIIDPEIRGYIKTINQFPFIRTTQCCQGHPGGGYLSVMVQEDMVKQFEEEVFFPLIKDIADKRYEDMYDGTIIIRYGFRFEPEERDEFFKAFILKLSRLV